MTVLRLRTAAAALGGRRIDFTDEAGLRAAGHHRRPAQARRPAGCVDHPNYRPWLL